jgi:hypothetical protein
MQKRSVAPPDRFFWAPERLHCLDTEARAGAQLAHPNVVTARKPQDGADCGSQGNRRREGVRTRVPPPTGGAAVVPEAADRRPGRER